MQKELDKRIEYDFDLALKLHGDEIKVTNRGIIYNLLNIIDPTHSIVINNEIGLLGNIDCEVTQDILGKQVVIGEIIDNRDNTIVKRGNYFSVLEKNIGTYLFDEYITNTLIINEDNHNRVYVFVLKDYKVINELDRSLLEWNMIDEETVSTPAIIIYKEGKLYTNCKELENKYCYNKDIQINVDICNKFNMLYEGKNYKSYRISEKNGIYKMDIIRMHI